MSNIKIFGIIVASCINVALLIITVIFVLSHLWALYAVLVTFAVLMVSGGAMAVYWIYEKIEARRAKIKLHAIEVQERQMGLEERRHGILLQYEQINVVRENNSWMSFGGNNVLASRTGNGEIRIDYTPKLFLSAGDTEVVKEDETIVEEINETIYASDMMRDYGRVAYEKVLIGINGKLGLIARKWDELGSILILGVMGGGKSNTATWIVSQETSRGAQVVLIDKHMKSDESLYFKLKMLVDKFETPVADNPTATERVVKYVKNMLDERMSRRQQKEDYRVIFVIDEFTAMMRDSADKNSEWYGVCKELASLIEKLNSEGRKFGINVVCIGQVTNASRSGGTEVRDLFKTRIIHGMRKKQAQNLGLTEEKRAIQQLDDGEVYVDIEGKSEPFYTRVPYVDNAYIAQNTRSANVFYRRSEDVLDTFVTQVVEIPEHAENAPGTRLERDSERVLELRLVGAGKNKIIDELYGVKRGGSEKYKQAEKRYEEIIEELVQKGLLKEI